MKAVYNIVSTDEFRMISNVETTREDTKAVKNSKLHMLATKFEAVNL